MNYKKEMLKLTSQNKIDKWLKDNPMPKNWSDGNPYSWAYTEMNYQYM